MIAPSSWAARAKSYERMPESVMAILAPQPWPAAIHKEVAEKLDNGR